MSLQSGLKQKFICDDNLGKLARYLRVFGYDTLFFSPIDNSRLIQLSLDEKRYILTRDNRLIERTLVRDFFLITYDLWPDQLRAVRDRFTLRLSEKNMFTRCLEDNAVTRKVLKEKIKNLVYPYTYQHHDEYRQCPECGRVYWPGSHVEVIRDRLKGLGLIASE